MSKSPMSWFYLGAAISFVLSVVLWFFVDKDTGMFVGIWVPSILALGATTRRPE